MSAVEKGYLWRPIDGASSHTKLKIFLLQSLSKKYMHSFNNIKLEIIRTIRYNIK